MEEAAVGLSQESRGSTDRYNPLTHSVLRAQPGECKKDPGFCQSTLVWSLEQTLRLSVALTPDQPKTSCPQRLRGGSGGMEKLIYNLLWKTGPCDPPLPALPAAQCGPPHSVQAPFPAATLPRGSWAPVSQTPFHSHFSIFHSQNLKTTLPLGISAPGSSLYHSRMA